MSEPPTPDSPPLRPSMSHVVIAGGGVAALETAAALHSVAAAEVQLTVIAPDREFVHRSLEPFLAFGIEVPPRLSLAMLVDRLGADLVSDRLAWVDRERRAVHCASGDTLAFDALVLALGARVAPRFPHAMTLDDAAAGELQRLVADIRAGEVTKVAFVAPERMAWPLPLYEAALLTATVGAEQHRSLELTVVTAEAGPLQAFGDTASEAMLALLDEHGVRVRAATRCRVPTGDCVALTGRDGRTRELMVDRVVALPELVGPHVRGVPSASRGFMPIDRFCRVPGTSDIYAAGDGTDYPVKHGGIAAQQAGVVARSIAAAAGAQVTALPFHPTIHGLLLTGSEPRYLTARLTGGRAFGSRVSTALGDRKSLSAKVAAPYLSDLLQQIAR